MARDLELNSLDRYVKSSPRFVLEEYSHCEVPAGCGGVILRWRDRSVAVPVRLDLAVVGGRWPHPWVDGEQSRNARPALAPGRHVLIVEVDEVKPTEFTFLAWVRVIDAQDPLLWTADDRTGQWRWTATQPTSAAMTDPAFDDSAWPTVVPGEVRVGSNVAYSAHRLLELGADPVTIDITEAEQIAEPVAGAEPVADAEPATKLWLRAVFEVPGPALLTDEHSGTGESGDES